MVILVRAFIETCFYEKEGERRSMGCWKDAKQEAGLDGGLLTLSFRDVVGLTLHQRESPRPLCISVSTCYLPTILHTQSPGEWVTISLFDQ